MHRCHGSHYITMKTHLWFIDFNTWCYIIPYVTSCDRYRFNHVSIKFLFVIPFRVDCMCSKYLTSTVAADLFCFGLYFLSQLQ